MVDVEEYEARQRAEAKKSKSRNPFFNFVKKARRGIHGLRQARVVQNCAKKWRVMKAPEKEEFIQEAVSAMPRNKKAAYILDEEHLGVTCRRHLQYFKAATDTYVLHMRAKYFNRMEI